MSEVVERIREFVIKKCEQHKKNEVFGYYDYWNDHIKRVVYHAVNLAKEYGADIEIVEIAALLHDISMPSEYGDRANHYIYSTEITENLLNSLDYLKDKIESVKKCVFNHPGRNQHLRESLEEFCLSDADALAHFECIPSLFSLAYGIHKMNLDEGREFVKKRLQGDYLGLSNRTREKFKIKYEQIMLSLFVA